MTFEDRVRGLFEAFDFTHRQTRFIATVALHGGYCLRRQYGAFAGKANARNVSLFLDRLVDLQLAGRFRQRADREYIYHLHGRRLYRAMGDEHNRNRRQASAALIARRLMVLDYVLGHPELEWLATARDKVDLFAERYCVPRADLPQRSSTALPSGVAGTTRYFIHKLPVAVGGNPPFVSFVYLATDGAARKFDQFLADHARLLAWLPAWTVVAVGASARALATCEAVFARTPQRPEPPALTAVDDLRELFTARQLVEHGDLSRLSVTAIDRYRTLRDQFAGVRFEALYADWCRDGEPALAAYAAATYRPTASRGQFVTERLPFDYSLFGSLPGVA